MAGSCTQRKSQGSSFFPFNAHLVLLESHGRERHIKSKPLFTVQYQSIICTVCANVQIIEHVVRLMLQRIRLVLDSHLAFFVEE